MGFYDKTDKAVAYIKERCDIRPEILIMTGTGLGKSTGTLEDEIRIPYGLIPEFPISTVSGHAGELVLGRLGGKNVAVMRGRFHLYEGYSPEEIAFPIRVFHEMRVKTLILTNAAGGIGPDFEVGDLMSIRDHINLTGENPLVGENNNAWGPRFPDMSAAYDPAMAELIKKLASASGFTLREGVYVGLKGPSFETPAEIRFLKTIGGHAVGMSTVMEVISARHLGMRVAGISTITNINDPDRPQIATLESIMEEADRASLRLEKLLTLLVEAL
ncbi:purine-nucleoside phosphorylase [Desulfobotulus mexicanus]|uniref:Purine nucleoside phosphorylase n=1 Tax=Desulfobotulus mexicanus TaxID=2586642 RepID=A0A5Q4VE23_9BACT|nr:purine-nucleoside phosphorylase [Desulfobotulus mexicanus]TYT75213.1 purine-nucleoside phosphorylase [Desulfobotulus mexicanus]